MILDRLRKWFFISKEDYEKIAPFLEPNVREALKHHIIDSLPTDPKDYLTALGEVLNQMELTRY